MNKSRVFTIRTNPSNFEAAEKVAALTHRSVGALYEHALTLYIAKNYPAAFDRNAKLVLKLEEAPLKDQKGSDQ